jgi:hypothetical protein
MTADITLSHEMTHNIKDGDIAVISCYLMYTSRTNKCAFINNCINYYFSLDQASTTWAFANNVERRTLKCALI